MPGRDCSCFQAGPTLVSNRGRVGLAINTCTLGPTPGRAPMFLRLGSQFYSHYQLTAAGKEACLPFTFPRSGLGTRDPLGRRKASGRSNYSKSGSSENLSALYSVRVSQIFSRVALSLGVEGTSCWASRGGFWETLACILPCPAPSQTPG